MKIRAIELRNLRRFAGLQARISDIGDGVSVLSQPNEFGKSTFFDGLHALFFQPHRSSRAPVKSLQPHSGGAPEAAAELELPEGRFRFEKRWLSRPMARLLDHEGRILAQEDEAEAWLDRITGQGLSGQGLSGPSGLLWVRQGLLGMEPEGGSAADKSERERGLSARRDLISAVAGEIEMITGGRRMDQVLARINTALARLATATLRPRAGGEWAKACDEAATLHEERGLLAARAGRLSGALRQRTSLMRELAALGDPEARARDLKALERAEAALKAAENHAGQIRKAESDARLARLMQEHGETALRDSEALEGRLAGARAAAAKAREELAAADLAQRSAAGQEEAALAEHQKAQADFQRLSADFAAAQSALLAAAAQGRVTALTSALERAGAQRAALENHQAARALLKVTGPLFEAAEQAQALRDRLALLDEARLVLVRFDYKGAARVTQNGAAVEPQGLRLRGVTRFDLPGIGEMEIDPGLVADRDLNGQLQAAEAGLAEALEACGAPDLAAARAALAEAGRLDAAISQASALLAELAPEGIDALHRQRAAAAEAAGAGPAAPEAQVRPEDLARLQAALEPARAAEAGAQARRREAEARHNALRESRAAKEAAAKGADQSLAQIAGEAGDPHQLAAQILARREAALALAQAASEAGAALQQLQASAPDLATAEAAVTRLRSVTEGRRSGLARLESELAGVNGSIGTLADEGIEEQLGELQGREEAALARAARYEREVRALDRLARALEAARSEQRDAYFGPVLRELEPLLSILHPGAKLRIDDASLLPVALQRDGVDEALEILSGGTREQLAVLTRLAFARLFAEAGQPVPVILDDALVHSDDDRIEAMFTALHRVAQGQQILVLTCRQRAFAPLGGQRLQAELSPL